MCECVDVLGRYGLNVWVVVVFTIRYSVTVRNNPFPLSSDWVGELEFGLGVMTTSNYYKKSLQ